MTERILQIGDVVTAKFPIQLPGGREHIPQQTRKIH